MLQLAELILGHHNMLTLISIDIFSLLYEYEKYLSESRNDETEFFTVVGILCAGRGIFCISLFIKLIVLLSGSSFL